MSIYVKTDTKKTNQCNLFKNKMSKITKTPKIYQGSHGKYYIWNYIPYDEHFPLEWAMNPKKTMVTNVKEDGMDSYIIHGPDNCVNCLEVGLWNGVFIGYCANCCQKAYGFSRGNGMIDSGHEYTFDVNVQDRRSMWNTYMRGVSLSEIGDTRLDHYSKENSRYDEYGYWLTLNDKWDRKMLEYRNTFLELRKKHHIHRFDNHYFYPYLDTGYEIKSYLPYLEEMIDGNRWFDSF